MSESKDQKGKIRCVLIAGGKYHDIDFARLELLKLLAADERVRVRVFEDYQNTSAINEADFIVTYTCDVVPSLEAQEALRGFLQRGGRWYALHGTNSILRWLADGRVDSPRLAPLFMQTLGSTFVAHPPIAPYTVTVADPSHPLVKDVACVAGDPLRWGGSRFRRRQVGTRQSSGLLYQVAWPRRRLVSHPGPLPRALRFAALDGLLAERGSMRVGFAGVPSTPAARNRVGEREPGDPAQIIGAAAAE